MSDQQPPRIPGCYLLIVLGEPLCDEHKERILQKVAKGLLSWDTVATQCDLQHIEAVCQQITVSKDTELLIQHSTDRLAVEVLLNPQVFTLKQCLKNLLISPTGHKQLIFSGYSFAGTGSWMLQDGIFKLADMVEILQDQEVSAFLGGLPFGYMKLHIHCSEMGEWVSTNLDKMGLCKLLDIQLNPADSSSGVQGAAALLDFFESALTSINIENEMATTPVVGNIRFNKPTLYVFPSGQGDCSLFGVTGFTMLIDGGFTPLPCFWNFVRHLERLDSIMVTRLNESNLWGVSSLFSKKVLKPVYPHIGYVFCNIGEPSAKPATSPVPEKERNELLVNVIDVGHQFLGNLRNVGLSPHQCIRDNLNPVTLYHKVGHGTLDMFILNPPRDSRILRDFLTNWANSKDSFQFIKTDSAKGVGQIAIPISNAMSICCLLVWKPADANENITRMLFPGSAPQSRIFEGLDKIKHLDVLRHPQCSRASLRSTVLERTKAAKGPSATQEPPATRTNLTSRLRSASPSARRLRPAYGRQASSELDKGDSSDALSRDSPVHQHRRMPSTVRAATTRTTATKPDQSNNNKAKEIRKPMPKAATVAKPKSPVKQPSSKTKGPAPTVGNSAKQLKSSADILSIGQEGHQDEPEKKSEDELDKEEVDKQETGTAAADEDNEDREAEAAATTTESVTMDEATAAAEEEVTLGELDKESTKTDEPLDEINAEDAESTATKEIDGDSDKAGDDLVPESEGKPGSGAEAEEPSAQVEEVVEEIIEKSSAAVEPESEQSGPVVSEEEAAEKAADSETEKDEEVTVLEMEKSSSPSKAETMAEEETVEAEAEPGAQEATAEEQMDEAEGEIKEIHDDNQGEDTAEKEQAEPAIEETTADEKAASRRSSKADTEEQPAAVSRKSSVQESIEEPEQPKDGEDEDEAKDEAISSSRKSSKAPSEGEQVDKSSSRKASVADDVGTPEKAASRRSSKADTIPSKEPSKPSSRRASVASTKSEEEKPGSRKPSLAQSTQGDSAEPDIEPEPTTTETDVEELVKAEDLAETGETADEKSTEAEPESTSEPAASEPEVSSGIIPSAVEEYIEKEVISEARVTIEQTVQETDSENAAIRKESIDESTSIKTTPASPSKEPETVETETDSRVESEQSQIEKEDSDGKATVEETITGEPEPSVLRKTSLASLDQPDKTSESEIESQMESEIKEDSPQETATDDKGASRRSSKGEDRSAAGSRKSSVQEEPKEPLSSSRRSSKASNVADQDDKVSSKASSRRSSVAEAIGTPEKSDSKRPSKDESDKPESRRASVASAETKPDSRKPSVAQSTSEEPTAPATEAGPTVESAAEDSAAAPEEEVAKPADASKEAESQVKADIKEEPAESEHPSSRRSSKAEERSAAGSRKSSAQGSIHEEQPKDSELDEQISSSRRSSKVSSVGEQTDKIGSRKASMSEAVATPEQQDSRRSSKAEISPIKETKAESRKASVISTKSTEEEKPGSRKPSVAQSSTLDEPSAPASEAEPTTNTDADGEAKDETTANNDKTEAADTTGDSPKSTEPVYSTLAAQYAETVTLSSGGTTPSTPQTPMDGGKSMSRSGSLRSKTATSTSSLAAATNDPEPAVESAQEESERADLEAEEPLESSTAEETSSRKPSVDESADRALATAPPDDLSAAERDGETIETSTIEEEAEQPTDEPTAVAADVAEVDVDKGKGQEIKTSSMVTGQVEPIIEEPDEGEQSEAGSESQIEAEAIEEKQETVVSEEKSGSRRSSVESDKAKSASTSSSRRASQQQQQTVSSRKSSLAQSESTDQHQQQQPSSRRSSKDEPEQPSGSRRSSTAASTKAEDMDGSRKHSLALSDDKDGSRRSSVAAESGPGSAKAGSPQAEDPANTLGTQCPEMASPSKKPETDTDAKSDENEIEKKEPGKDTEETITEPSSSADKQQAIEKDCFTVAPTESERPSTDKRDSLIVSDDAVVKDEKSGSKEEIAESEDPVPSESQMESEIKSEESRPDDTVTDKPSSRRSSKVDSPTKAAGSRKSSVQGSVHEETKDADQDEAIASRRSSKAPSVGDDVDKGNSRKSSVAEATGTPEKPASRRSSKAESSPIKEAIKIDSRRASASSTKSEDEKPGSRKPSVAQSTPEQSATETEPTTKITTEGLDKDDDADSKSCDSTMAAAGSACPDSPQSSDTGLSTHPTPLPDVSTPASEPQSPHDVKSMSRSGSLREKKTPSTGSLAEEEPTEASPPAEPSQSSATAAIIPESVQEYIEQEVISEACVTIEETLEERDNEKTLIRKESIDESTSIKTIAATPTSVTTTQTTTGTSSSRSTELSQKPDPSKTVEEWGKPLGLPYPPELGDARRSVSRTRSSSQRPAGAKADTARQPTAARMGVRPSKATTAGNEPIEPVYLDLAYVPHHGDMHYCNADYFRRVRARYYVFSGVNPSREVFEALIEGKKSWETAETAQVTVIPTHETDALGYWMSMNQEQLEKYKIDVAPPANRCTVTLQDHETSCPAYRLEF